MSTSHRTDLPTRARRDTSRRTARLTALGVAPALALTLLGSAPTAQGSATVSSPAAQALATTPISVLSTGAKRGDGKNDLGAFNEAVRRAKAQNRPVTVPPGTYHLSGRLWLDGVTLRGAGRKRTTLVSTDPTNATIELTGRRPRLTRLRHVVPGASGRSPLPGRQNLRVQDARSFLIGGVHAVGAQGGGILVRRSHGGLIQDSVVARTLADGIHMNQGSSNILVRRNVVRATGDDGIAVVSYQGDKAVVRRIKVRRNRVVRGKTRGITVVGGRRVAITHNKVRKTESGGIYIAAEKEWNTYGVHTVWVTGNRVVGAPTRNSHASILVYSSGRPIDDVWFRRNTVLGATRVGYGVWLHPSGSGSVGDLTYRGNLNAKMASSAWARTWFRAGRVHRSNNRGF